jgi:rhamnulokinase
VGTEVAEAALGEAVRRHNFTNEGGVDGTYRLLKNVMGMWLLQRLRAAFESRGHSYDYTQLVQLASQAPPLRSLIHPDAAEFVCPPNMIEAIQESCRRSGQPIPESAGQLVRCVLESLALRYRDVLASLEEITGESIQAIHIVGGGSKNALLNQFTADACRRLVLAGPVEATALGNILVQARSVGEIDSLSDLRAIVRDSFEPEIREFLPCRESASAWDAAFGRWQNLVGLARV